MKRQRRGVFLITASTSAIRPRPGGQVYAASKGAVVVLAKALALETAPHGVRVVAIAPVATHTPMLPTFMSKTEVDEEGLARYIATVPLGRLNEPEDVARTAVFLASDDAAMITGSCVEVEVAGIMTARCGHEDHPARRRLAGRALDGDLRRSRVHRPAPRSRGHPGPGALRPCRRARRSGRRSAAPTTGSRPTPPGPSTSS